MALGLSAPVIATLLAACGGDDDDAPSGGGSGSGTTASGSSARTASGSSATTAAGTEASGSSGEPITVVMAQGVDATFLDPHIDGSGAQLNIHKHTHDTLVYFDREHAIAPLLAESYEIPDPLTYQFKLKQGVKFHDGTEMTASDVVFNLLRCRDFPETQIEVDICDTGLYVDTAEATDDYTVDVTLKMPDATFLARMASIYIVPETAVREMGPEAFNQKPIGTGAFQFVEWVKDQYVKLEKFDDYFGGAPLFDELIIRPIPESSTRVSALRNGEVDIIYNVPPDSVQLIEDADGVHPDISESNRFIFIYLNTFEPPFDNVLVRKAVNYAVDWPTIIETVLNGQAYETPMPITPYDFPYEALKDIGEEKAYHYDPDRAKELLAEAGYPDGFDLELEGPDGRYLQDAEVLAAVGGFLDQVGIRTTINTQEWGIYYQERFYAGVVKAGLFGMGNTIYDIDWLMGNHFDPDRRSFYYNTPRLKELIDAGLATPVPEERIEIYREAMNIIMDDAPWIFGYGQMNIFGVSDRLDWTAPPGDEQIVLINTKVTG
jgi:peptide/nickel transport system substrate-binding protein